MAVLSFNIPDNQVQRLLDTLAVAFGVDPTVGAVKQEIAKTILRMVRDTERNIEAEADALAFETNYTAPDLTP